MSDDEDDEDDKNILDSIKPPKEEAKKDS